MLQAFVVARKMRDRYGQAPGLGTGNRNRMLTEERNDPRHERYLRDMFPVQQDKTTGDRKSEQDRNRHAEALARPLEARLPTKKPVNRLFERPLEGIDPNFLRRDWPFGGTLDEA